MKKILFLLILSIFLILFLINCSDRQTPSTHKNSTSFMSSNTNKDILDFGFVPSSNVINLSLHYRPLKKYLEKKLNKKIELRFKKNYESIINNMNHELDFSTMGAYSYIKAANKYDIKPMVRSVRYGKEYYRGIILVKKNSNINNIADLKNKSIGFTDRFSTSGFLSPAALLIKNGLDIKSDLSHYTFYKKHDNVVKAVILGQVDAGACYEGAETKFLSKSEYSKIKILAHTSKIPGDLIVASDALVKQPDLLNKITQAFLELNSKKNKNIFKSLGGGLEKFVPAHKKDYKELNKIIKIVNDSGI